MGGQNGFLSAALLGFGLLGVQSSPVLGGMILGLLQGTKQLRFLRLHLPDGDRPKQDSVPQNK